MSFWADVLRGLQQAALLKDKVDRALAAAEEAQCHSTQNRERIIALETVIDLAMKRSARRLPPG